MGFQGCRAFSIYPQIETIMRSADQNYNEISPHTGQNGHHQKHLQTVNAGEDVEKREPSCILGGNENRFRHYREPYEGSLGN